MERPVELEVSLAEVADIDPDLAPALGAEPESDAAALIADPSDYTVATDGTIEVQSNETLGHFADWLGLRTNRLRSINGLSYGDDLIVHGRIRLDFAQTTPEEFEHKRIAYHRGLQESFFDEWEIDGIESHRVRPGDSAWVLSHRRFDVPLWLLRQYNPDLDFDALSVGTRITVPKLKKRTESVSQDVPIAS
jgi:membrane-bound lytic murein transglycosylase D